MPNSDYSVYCAALASSGQGRLGWLKAGSSMSTNSFSINTGAPAGAVDSQVLEDIATILVGVFR